MELPKFLWIGLGGFIGANLRYLVQGWAAQRWGADFPFGTMLANVTGSFILAFFVVLAGERILVNPAWRLFLAIGLLGGYTTFSSFSVETLFLLESGRWLSGALNLLGNVLLGVGAAILGAWLARLI